MSKRERERNVSKHLDFFSYVFMVDTVCFIAIPFCCVPCNPRKLKVVKKDNLECIEGNYNFYRKLPF